MLERSLAVEYTGANRDARALTDSDTSCVRSSHSLLLW